MRLAGEAEIVKSGGCGGGVTTRVTVVECCNAPSAPVMVRVYVPCGVEVEVLTLSVELPEPPTMEAGVKLALAPAGKPLTLRLTVSVNPPIGVTVVVYEVPLPACTVCDAGEALMLKSPTIAAFTTRETEAV